MPTAGLSRSSQRSPPVRDRWRGAVYIALGVTREGEREVLGLWIADSWRDQDLIQQIKSPDNGAKFWLSVMNELRNPIVGETIPRIVS